eukprot:s6489_g2.t1
MGPRDTSKALELRRSTLHAWCWIAKSHLRGAPSAKAGYQAPLSRCTGPGGILSNASMFGISSALLRHVVQEDQQLSIFLTCRDFPALASSRAEPAAQGTLLPLAACNRWTDLNSDLSDCQKVVGQKKAEIVNSFQAIRVEVCCQTVGKG